MTMNRNTIIENIRRLMGDEYINSIKDAKSRHLMMWKRDQAQRCIDHTPLEEMHRSSLYCLYNALDHAESR